MLPIEFAKTLVAASTVTNNVQNVNVPTVNDKVVLNKESIVNLAKGFIALSNLVNAFNLANLENNRNAIEVCEAMNGFFPESGLRNQFGDQLAKMNIMFENILMSIGNDSAVLDTIMTFEPAPTIDFDPLVDEVPEDDFEDSFVSQDEEDEEEDAPISSAPGPFTRLFNKIRGY